MASWLCVRPVFTNLSDMKLKNIVINGSLLILSVITALVIGELFIRNFYPQPIYAVTYSPWGWKHAQIKGGVSFNRGMETRENISRITYNSFGLRNTYDPVVPKPPNVYRILLLGDSFTDGLEVSDAEVVSAVLEKKLQDYLKGRRKIEVLNAGVSGFSYGQMAMYLQMDGIKLQPDLIVIIDSNCDTRDEENNFVRLKDGRLEFYPMTFTDKQVSMKHIKTNLKIKWQTLTVVKSLFARNPEAYKIMNRIVKFLGFDFMSSIDWVPQVKRATLLEQSLNIKKEINNAVENYPLLPINPTIKVKLVYLKDDLVTTKEMGLSGAVFSFISQLAKKNDARLIIATMRIERGIENLPKRASFFKAIGADFINLYTPDNNFHYKYDGHWNAIGHFRTGTLLAGYVFNNYIMELQNAK